MLKSFIAISLFFSVGTALVAQVNLIAPNEIILCNDADNAHISAYHKDAINYVWEYAYEISNLYTHTISVKPSVSKWYRVKAILTQGEELVANGTFDDGDAGFKSEYTLLLNPDTATANFSEGKYIIDNTPKNKHPCFAGCVDFPSGSGKMMIVNGADVPNVVVWEQNISIQPNTDYAFTAWVQNVSCGSGLPAKLQFSINGKLLNQPFESDTSLCQWSRFFTLWNSSSHTSAKISIVNQSTLVSGNDFALDNISFKKYNETKDSVFVKVLSNQIKKYIAICNGDSAYIKGKYRYQQENFKEVFKNNNGCDSIILTSLYVYPKTFKHLVTLCFRDSIFLQKKFRKNPGTYYDTLKSALGCDSIAIVILKVIEPQFKAITATICEGENFTHNLKTYYKAGDYFDTVYYNQCAETITQISITVLPNTITQLSPKWFCQDDSVLYKTGIFINTDTIIYDSLKSQTGCDSVITHPFKTFKSNYNITSTGYFCENEPAIFDAGEGFLHYWWSNGLTDRYFSTVEEGEHSVFVMDTNYCIWGDTVYAYERCRPIFYVPSAFTINNDGLNDYFSIYTRNVMALKFIILNRWGEIVFETTDINFKWNGLYNNSPVPEGVYQWIGSFEGYNLDGQILTENKNGTIHLLR